MQIQTFVDKRIYLQIDSEPYSLDSGWKQKTSKKSHTHRFTSLLLSERWKPTFNYKFKKRKTMSIKLQYTNNSFIHLAADEYIE